MKNKRCSRRKRKDVLTKSVLVPASSAFPLAIDPSNLISNDARPVPLHEDRLVRRGDQIRGARDHDTRQYGAERAQQHPPRSPKKKSVNKK